MIARLFVAAMPPPRVVSHIRELGWSEPGVVLTSERSLHVTLRFFGETELEPVRDRLAELSLPGAVAALGPWTVTPFGPTILLAPVRGLDQLEHELTVATADLGAPPAPFFGHMEVARSAETVEGPRRSGDRDRVRGLRGRPGREPLGRLGPVFTVLETFATTSVA